MLAWSLEIILYTVFDQDSALEKNLSSNGPVLSPNKHSPVLLLPLDVMVIMEKDSVTNGKDQRLIIAVSVMFIHFQVSNHSLIIFWVTVQHFLVDLFTYADLVNFTLNAQHFTPRLKGKSLMCFLVLWKADFPWLSPLKGDRQKVDCNMMNHRETVADGVYRMISYNLLCFASVPVFIFGGAVRKVAGINYHNPITESCHATLSKWCVLVHWLSWRTT